MLGQLIEQSNEVTVVDMEASVEHMSRGTVRHVDTLLIVTEPYFRSLETVGRTAPLAADLGIARRLVVANKVRTPRDAEAIAQYCAERGLEIAATLPFDDAVTEADATGRPVIDHAPQSSYVHTVDALVARLSAAA